MWNFEGPYAELALLFQGFLESSACRVTGIRGDLRVVSCAPPASLQI